MKLAPHRLLPSSCCTASPNTCDDLAMTSADRVPLVDGSSDSGEEASDRGRRRRQQRLRLRRQRPSAAAPYRLPPSSPGPPATALVQIQVRRCSRVGRTSFSAADGVRSTPDLHVDGLSDGGSPAREWAAPERHLRAGTPPERGNRPLEGPHHSRSQSCRAPRKAGQFVNRHCECTSVFRSGGVLMRHTHLVPLRYLTLNTWSCGSYFRCLRIHKFYQRFADIRTKNS